ncbi:hypothetical protein CJ263_18805 [Maribacter cobaltidurans]|uniref:Uncharacterized protein n=1 Tax=Maribacter cobaltidurans TaxID=1178778 RepID=A0A223V9Y0_9FLAO|nr:hypothetical protein CJ263_18805 [Maribacter cobaltidurans]
MLFKVSSFHIYSHQDNSADKIENCITCYFSFQDQTTSFQIATIVVVALLLLAVPYKKLNLETTTSLSSILIPYNSFGRPPPYLR